MKRQGAIQTYHWAPNYAKRVRRLEAKVAYQSRSLRNKTFTSANQVIAAGGIRTVNLTDLISSNTAYGRNSNKVLVKAVEINILGSDPSVDHYLCSMTGETAPTQIMWQTNPGAFPSNQAGNPGRDKYIHVWDHRMGLGMGYQIASGTASAYHKIVRRFKRGFGATYTTITDTTGQQKNLYYVTLNNSPLSDISAGAISIRVWYLEK